MKLSLIFCLILDSFYLRLQVHQSCPLSSVLSFVVVYLFISGIAFCLLKLYLILYNKLYFSTW